MVQYLQLNYEYILRVFDSCVNNHSDLIENFMLITCLFCFTQKKASAKR